MGIRYQPAVFVLLKYTYLVPIVLNQSSYPIHFLKTYLNSSLSVLENAYLKICSFNMKILQKFGIKIRIYEFLNVNNIK